MPRMRLQKLDMWVRLSAGCGLIILVSAQQKLCPWLFSAPGEPPAPAAPVTDTESDQQRRTTDPRHRDAPPPRLPYLLQGATNAAPRAATHWSPTSYRATTGWRDGVSAASLSVPAGPADAGAVAVSQVWPHATELPVAFCGAACTLPGRPQHLSGVTLYPNGPPA